jgi:hypothetical protein
VTKHAIISLDFRFADDRVTNAAYGSAATLLDYDIAIWNPAGLLFNYRGVGESKFQGLRRLNETGSFALPKDVVRRKTEMSELLKLGRTLVAFSPYPESWYLFTGDENRSGTGKNQQVTRIVTEMSTDDVFPYAVTLIAAAGERMRLVTGEPFASFWRECKEFFAYSAYLEKRLGATQLVIADTEHPVATIARVGDGTLILLPAFLLPQAPAEDEWALEEEDEEELEERERDERNRRGVETAFLDRLLELVEALRTQEGDFALPEWTADVRLPSEEDVLSALSREQDRLDVQLAKIDEEKRRIAELQRRKLMFTGTGTALENVAEEAFKALGCEVEPGDTGRTDRVLRRGDDVAVVEIKGKTKSGAESDAAQLEKWVSEHKVNTEEDAKGILVVNTWRTTPVSDRSSPDFPDQMLPYATSRGHCLMTGLQLLGAWLDCEAHPEKRDAIFDSMRDCVGRYENYSDWREFLRPISGDVRAVDAEDSETEDKPRQAASHESVGEATPPGEQQDQSSEAREGES